MATPDFPSFPRGVGIIFDMDGLLIDTERIAKIAWQQTARLAGHEMSDALFESLIGRRELDAIGILAAAYGPDFDFKKANAQCNALFDDYLARHGLPLKPGAHELLGDLCARKIPLGLATSTQNPIAGLRLQQAGLRDYFSVVVAGNEIKHGKPAPDIYLEAVRRLGLDAPASFALEDSYAGVRAAHAAGLNVIMVPDLVQPTPEIAALTARVAPSLHEARHFFARLW